MRWFVLLVLPMVVVLVSSAAWAEGPGRPTVSLVASPAASPADQNDRAIHLREAAEHLQAAGLESLAAHVRELSSKPADTRQPNRPKPAEVPAQVLLELKVVEFDVTRMRRLGMSLAQFQPDRNVSEENLPGRFGHVLSAEQRAKFLELVEALRADGVARILAEPTLVTIDGRPAHFHSGGEVMVWMPGPKGVPALQPKPYGTMVDFLPVLDGEGGLRLELRFKYTAIARDRSVKAGGLEIPAFDERTMETGLAMKLGEPFLLFGPSRTNLDKANAAHELTTAILVTAEAVDRVAATPSAKQR